MDPSLIQREVILFPSPLENVKLPLKIFTTRPLYGRRIFVNLYFETTKILMTYENSKHDLRKK